MSRNKLHCGYMWNFKSYLIKTSFSSVRNLILSAIPSHNRTSLSVNSPDSYICEHDTE
ncbi:hypothetical protein J6590_080597, partial [Homalodisca vitripennis]